MTIRVPAGRAAAGHVGWALLLLLALLAGRASRPEGSELAVVWPAAAVTVVWLLRTRPGRARAGVTAALVATVVTVNAATGVDPVAAALFGGVNAAHGWVGLRVLEARRWPSSAFLPRLRDAVTLGWTALLASLVSGLLTGVLAAWRLDASLLTGTPMVVVRNALSTVVIGAALLAVPHLLPVRGARLRVRGEVVAIVVGGTASHAFAFRAIGDSHPVAFVLTAVWVLVGARVSPACASVLVASMAVPTVVATSIGEGAFATQNSPAEQVLLLQLFLAVNSVVAIGLAVLSSERRAALAEAQRRSDELEAYLQASLVGFAVLDVTTGVLTSANPALCRLLGLGHGELVGSPWRRHVTEPDALMLEGALAELRAGTAAAWHAELAHRTADGDVRLTQVALAVLPSTTGCVATVQFLDVTDRRAAEQQLAHRVLHDELTGLPNRTLLRDRLDTALAQSRLSGVDDVAVLFFDLDHFKAVNDTHGHEVGDRLLVETGRRMSAALRPGDTVARVGGDEFVALCNGVSGAAEAAVIARRVLATVSCPVRLGEVEVTVALSAGVALARPGDTAASLLQQSDTAMFSAKHQGRGRVAGAEDEVPVPRRPRPVVRVP